VGDIFLFSQVMYKQEEKYERKGNGLEVGAKDCGNTIRRATTESISEFSYSRPSVRPSNLAHLRSSLFTSWPIVYNTIHPVIVSEELDFLN
jgi:hypothetical protein